tara:strand:+ start:89 stop:1054 length:966 start_codon:yes stop_codon:yes gene_type:complete
MIKAMAIKRISLSAYALHIRKRKKSKKGDFEKLSNFGGNDFYDALSTYTDTCDDTFVDIVEMQKVLSFIKQIVTAKEQSISGIIASGDYGYESEIYDTVEKVKTHTKTTKEAEVIPFYYHAYIPKEKESGILILQRFGVFGITSIFRKWIHAIFIREFPHHCIDIVPLVPQNYAKQLFNDNHLLEIRLRKSNLPADIGDMIDPNFLSADDSTLDYVIKSKTDIRGFRQKIARRIKTSMSSSYIPDFAELLNHETLDCDEIIVTMDLGDTKKTVNLGKLDLLHPSLDISDDVKRKASGHPDFDSVDKLAKDYCNKLQSSIGL